MEPGASPNCEELSLLACLEKSDVSAWCFVPSEFRTELRCSPAFLRLWDISPHVQANEARTICLLKDFVESLRVQGISPEDFLDLVGGAQASESPPILLVCQGNRRIQAHVIAVYNGDRVIGQLVRFHSLSDGDILQALVLQVSAAQRKLDVLSARERQILQMVFDGRTNKAISIGAAISEKTVEKHRSRIMQKLGLNCTAQLFRLVSKAWLFSDILGLSAAPGEGRGNGASPKPAPPAIACDDD